MPPDASLHFQNWYVTRLREAVDNTATTIYVDNPPAIGSGILVLEGKNASKREIIYFSSVDGYALKDCVRGLEGTAPNTHNQGATIEQAVTAGQLDQVLSPHILLQGLGNDQNAAMSQDAVTRAITQKIYPVGSVYINATNSTNPGTLLGFGTWVAFGAGRVPVGFDSSQTEFNSAEKTGGAKTVSLTAAQNGKHNHSGSIGNGGVHNHGIRVLSGSGNGFEPKAGRGGMQTGYIDGDGLHSHSLTINDSGSGSPHNNLQPYITVYMWKRVS